MQRYVVVGSLIVLFLSACISNEPKDSNRGRNDDETGRHAPNQGGNSHGNKKLTKAPPRPRGIRPNQIKAIWVDAWGPGFCSAKECDDLIAWCLRQGFNTLLVEVRRTGDAYFDSRLEPRGTIGESSRIIDTDFDPLQYLIEQGRDRHGLRVEAWVVANRIWVGENPPGVGTPSHIVTAHADWLLVNRAGKTHTGQKPSWFVDPSSSPGRRHLEEICLDLAERYRIDAIHLDYIRYPDHNWGYGLQSLARFRAEEGTNRFPAVKDSKFIQWRARQVTEQVRGIRAVLNQRAPQVQLTAATLAWGNAPKNGYKQSAGYSSACQDWPRWCREDLIDLAYVMHYRRESDRAQSQQFRAWLPILKGEVSRPSQLIIGLGSYLNSPSAARRQLRVAMGSNPRGVAVFSYRNPAAGGDQVTFSDILQAKKF